MANLTSVINVNVPVEVKEEANNIFNSLGLNMSTAINMFLKKTIHERGIPFEVKQQPSHDFLENCRELDDMENGKIEFKKFNSISKLMEDLKN